MSDGALRDLACAAGLQVEWTDTSGHLREVSLDTLQTVLQALGYSVCNRTDILESQRRLDEQAHVLPFLLTVRESESVCVGHVSRARLRTQDGEWRELKLRPLKVGGSCARAPAIAGYYQLELDDDRHVLAVVPARCFSISEIFAGRRLAALSVQTYSLRGRHTSGFGDYTALSELAAEVGPAGIDAFSISPTHARLSADAGNIRPYAPSTRYFFDPLYADVTLAGDETARSEEPSALINWPEVHARKFAQLRSAYEGFVKNKAGEGGAFRKFCEQGGQPLLDHAVFEALDAHFRAQGKSSQGDWPHAFRDPRSRDVQEFAQREKNEVEYHLYLQWVTARSAAAAQTRAKAHMAIGLIADIAVGVDRAGSHAWSAPQELIGNLTIGAPPDAFNAAGQDWGLTTFSPTALRATGYDGFIATLRAGMAYAGGIRIDHAMGLRRLWVLPAGASPEEGVYLSYPLQDLLRLTSLESVLHRSVVIGEDLGTVPDGFRAQLSAAGILGMRVLWFERDDTGAFIRPERWESQAVALTTTHDLPTVAGWWKGRDIDWAAKLKRKTGLGSIGAERQERQKDRGRLWSALSESECVSGVEPPEDKAEAVVDGALSYISKTPCVLAMASVEDILTIPEQPNMPGTIDEHPNWRQRLPADVSWNDAEISSRLAKLTARRHP